jgi:hypothetical protein
VYRITGTADDDGIVMPWSLILKVSQSPANLGLKNMGGGSDGSHWNYWRRELLLFQTGMLDTLPPGLVAPRFYGGRELPGNVSWLWLEDIGDASEPWTPRRYERAAYDLGRFNGAYLVRQPLPRVPWLSRNTARQFSAFAREMLPTIETYLPDVRRHPVIRFILDSDDILDELERLPLTFCHFDAGAYNLLIRHGQDGSEEIVAVDWALAGIGPVGAELSQLTVQPQSTRQVVMQGSELALIERYLEGLHDAGWHGKRDLVLFGYAASMVFRLGGFLLAFLEMDLQAGRSRSLRSTSIPGLLPYAEQARELLPRL